MSENETQSRVETTGTPAWLKLMVLGLAGLSLTSFGLGWGATKRAKSLEQTLAGQTQALKQNQDTLAQRLGQDEQSHAQVRNGLDTVSNGLKLTQGELTAVRRVIKQVKEDDARLMAGIQDSMRSMNADLATRASAADLNRLGGDVTGVKSELEAVKQNIGATRGELGALIAQNNDAIEQLRRAGQRDRYEFTIDRRGVRQKVGNLELELRGTNVKKNFFSVAVYVDDTRYEKRNRSVNEPIYLRTREASGPLELVINQVGRDKVAGYLSVPRVNAQQQASGN